MRRSLKMKKEILSCIYRSKDITFSDEEGRGDCGKIVSTQLTSQFVRI